jgi:hypothetical protein
MNCKICDEEFWAFEWYRNDVGMPICNECLIYCLEFKIESLTREIQDVKRKINDLRLKI